MEKSWSELYQLVGAKPMKHLAKVLGLSDMGTRKIREKRKGLNPTAERLESFRILASDQAESYEQYWGLDFIEEEHDHDFEAAPNDVRLIGE